METQVDVDALSLCSSLNPQPIQNKQRPEILASAFLQAFHMDSSCAQNPKYDCSSFSFSTVAQAHKQLYAGFPAEPFREPIWQSQFCDEAEVD